MSQFGWSLIYALQETADNSILFSAICFALNGWELGYVVAPSNDWQKRRYIYFVVSFALPLVAVQVHGLLSALPPDFTFAL